MMQNMASGVARPFMMIGIEIQIYLYGSYALPRVLLLNYCRSMGCVDKAYTR